MKMRKAEDYRNEIKSYIVRAGMTMSELVEILADEYGWSASVPNLSGKLQMCIRDRCIENEILMYIRKISGQKAEISLDEPINTDWDGNELLLRTAPMAH